MLVMLVVVMVVVGGGSGRGWGGSTYDMHGRSRMLTDPSHPYNARHGARRFFTRQAGIARTKREVK